MLASPTTTPSLKRKPTSPPKTTNPPRKKPNLAEEIFGFSSDEEEDEDIKNHTATQDAPVKDQLPREEPTPTPLPREEFTPLDVLHPEDKPDTSDDENASADMFKTEFKRSSKSGQARNSAFGAESQKGKKGVENSGRATVDSRLTTPEREKIRARKDNENRTPPGRE